MEGILTLIVAIASYWMLSDWPDRSHFLTPLEKSLVSYRLRTDQGKASEGHFSWAIVRTTLLDWKVYCMMLMYIGAGAPVYAGS